MRQKEKSNMTRWFATLILFLSCISVESAILEFAFQLGEKQEPRLDRLLPDVARQMAFNKNNTKLIARGMGGSVVEWDIQSRQKREIGDIHAKRWFIYSAGADRLLVRDANDDITILSVGRDDETPLTHGEYEHGSLSADGSLAVLSKGNDEVEVWQLANQSLKTVIHDGAAQKLKTLRTGFPVRNGLTLSDDGQFIAAAEGSYRDGEGHRTAIEVWNTTDEYPTHVFDTGEILGIWNVLFSPDATLLAVDTQKNAQSGIRVWEIKTGRRRLAKGDFEAYWTRALAFSPTSDYLASGGEAGNLRVWDISEGESVIWETYPTGIQSLAFSPNGEYLAVALWDATIQILYWRVNNEQ
jgi:WD40 repeat protein